MLGKRLGFILDTLVLLVITGISTTYAWHYVAAIDDAGILRDTKMLPIPILPGAIHFALGRGVGVTHEKEEGFPELEEFLTSRIFEIPREVWPEPGSHPKADGHYFYMHYYLIAYLGGIFYLLGISLWSFRVACVLLHVTSMMALYGIFRLFMGRVLGLLLVSFLSISHAYLVMLPIMRDLSKAPFILAALLLIGILVKHPVARSKFFLISILLGGIMGVGYGFRQDVFVCVPLALFCILTVTRPASTYIWRVRVAACLLLVGAFTLAAVPVFKGDREVGGTIAVHTLFQGVMRCAEDNAAFYSDSYDFGYLNYDHPVTAQIRAYAKRTGDIYPVNDLTPAYGKVGGRMFREYMRSYPADLVGRVAAVLDSLNGIFAASFSWSAEHSETVSDGYVYGGKPIETFQQVIGRFLDAYGFAIMLVALLFLAAKKFRSAFLVVLMLGYFSAYPSTLFEFRHYYYLAFTPLLFVGITVTLLYQGLSIVFLQYTAVSWKERLRAGFRSVLRGVCFVTAWVFLAVLLLSALRGYQYLRRNWLLDRYASASLSKISLVENREGDKVRLFLPQNLTELLHQSPPAAGEVGAFYLAARFQGGDRTVSFQLINNNPVFTRPCHVILRGSGVYFFPVYECPHDVPLTFLGIEMDAADRPYFEDLYLCTDADSLRLWPYIFVPEKREDFAYCKLGRLDRWGLGVLAEAQGGFGLWPERILEAHLELIARHPFHAPFANQALKYAQRCGMENQLVKTWETIGTFMPDQRAKAGAWMVRRADEALKRQNTKAAVVLYEKACHLLPTDQPYQEKLGELLEMSGEQAKAIETYKNILKQYPESPAVAYRLYTLMRQETPEGEALAYWDKLLTANPGRSIPQLYYGIALEEHGNPDLAIEVYQQIPAESIASHEALFRQGILKIKHGPYERGTAQLLELQKNNPEYQKQVANAFIELGIQLKAQNNYDAAAHILEALLGIQSDNLDIKATLGEIYELQNKHEKALSFYEKVLMEHPDLNVVAKRLDALYAKQSLENNIEGEEDGDIHAFHFWRSLESKYSGEALPLLYLGNTLERAGQMDKAALAYQKALSLRPVYPEASYRLGILKVLLGETNSGLRMIRDAAASDPALASDMSRRCDAVASECIAQKQYQTAMLLYDTALAVSPGDLWPRVHQGELHELLGEKEAAADSYRAVLMAVPDSPVSAKRLDDLLRLRSGGSDIALAEWRAIAARYPDAAIPALYLGISLESAGDKAGAIAAYTKALALNPDLVEARKRLETLVKLNASP